MDETKIASIRKLSDKTRRKMNRKKTVSLNSVTRKFKKNTEREKKNMSKFKRHVEKKNNEYLSFDDDEYAVFAITPDNAVNSAELPRFMDGEFIETSFSLNNSIPLADSLIIHSTDRDGSLTGYSVISKPLSPLNGSFSDYSVVSKPLSPLDNTNDYYENDELLFQKLAKKQNIKTKQAKLNNIKSIVFDKKIVKYLNSICTDSGECLAFGRESAEIRNIFDDFIDFKHLKKVEKVGQPSANGFVLNLHYETMSYKANALLKSSQGTMSDNLFYEYLVGIHFINKVNEVFPCFTETYHLFKHKSIDTKRILKKHSMNVNEYMTVLQLNNCDRTITNNIEECIDDSCENGENYAILVQYINNPISVDAFMKEHENDELFEQQMLCILYQIYYPLSYLKEDFTHYDLHTDNVLLYKLPDGKFVSIQYKNTITGTIININTNYIAKIIDYGRCFFSDFGDDNLLSSKSILKTVKESIVCKTNGFNKIGFNFRDRNHTVENHYISCMKKNESHDLRLASIIVKRSRKMKNLFGSDRIIYTGYYGTPENISYDKYHIRNLDDMITHLDYLVRRNVPSIGRNDTPIGIIKVQLRGAIMDKMRFIPIN